MGCLPGCYSGRREEDREETNHPKYLLYDYLEFCPRKKDCAFLLVIGYFLYNEEVSSRRRGTQNEKGRVCKALFGGSIPSRASTSFLHSSIPEK
jgi:hypothetical protein